MKSQYEKLGVEEFGAQLLQTNDLDPVYVALHEMMRDGFEESQTKRWLVAYWCLYHCGAASWLSQCSSARFWTFLHDAAENTVEAPGGGRWPRGHERRHWRGQAAVRSARELAARYRHPEEFAEYVASPPDAGSVVRRVKEHYLFGPWIAFKVADMADRVLGSPVDFTEGDVFVFKDPVQGALMVWRDHLGMPDNAQPKDKDTQRGIVTRVVAHLTSAFDTYRAPPLYDRPVGLQEVETVLCKWKSHMRGSYPLWNDIDEITSGLQRWSPYSPAAQKMLEHMPRRTE